MTTGGGARTVKEARSRIDAKHAPAMIDVSRRPTAAGQRRGPEKTTATRKNYVAEKKTATRKNCFAEKPIGTGKSCGNEKPIANEQRSVGSGNPNGVAKLPS